ncbi:hypothetical protein Q1695_013225 [Nippostrongylus brasiliensis]|nr:hypothetical protein Q1695_013225 [Nippostrongylus brasiliensis]
MASSNHGDGLMKLRLEPCAVGLVMSDANGCRAVVVALEESFPLEERRTGVHLAVRVDEVLLEGGAFDDAGGGCSALLGDMVVSRTV